MDGNDTHWYYPDFLVDEVYVEIKGDHLIKDGIILGYDGTPMLAKTRCLNELGVIIKTKKDLQAEFEYVYSVYGKGYLKKLRVPRLKRRVNDKDTIDCL